MLRLQKHAVQEITSKALEKKAREAVELLEAVDKDPEHTMRSVLVRVLTELENAAHSGSRSTFIRLTKLEPKKNEVSKVLRDLGYTVSFQFSNDSEMDCMTIEW